MIPVGYMAKRVSVRPAWLQPARILDVYSVSGCISANFTDYVQYWKHNGYWLFDSPAIIREISRDHAIDLAGLQLFYYEVCGLEFDDLDGWRGFAPEASFKTQVVAPAEKVLEGYDVVTYSAGTSAECSPLSCNALALEVETNPHCLLASVEDARRALEDGRFRDSEPGPYRIVAVYSTPWPWP